MSDEEKAEEIIKEKYCNNCEERETFPNIYNCSNKEHCDDYYLLKEGILLGLAEGKKETEKQWHDCFLTCSSPFCAKHFPEVKIQGELGNMTND